jgi:methyltransferase (TIGR00027 family)
MAATPPEGAGLGGGQPSRTAMLAALGRGLHRFHYEPPWIFDDPYAVPLVGPGWPDMHAALVSVVGEDFARRLYAMGTARARYTEDRLPGVFEQYVILGAGLDSFAWRRPDLMRNLRVFEVDHPATQEWKRARIAALGLPLDGAVTFAPIDFQSATLHEGLSAAGFDWSRPALFSCLGVTVYLPLEAVEATLRTIAGGAPGSEVVLSYVPPRDHLEGADAAIGEILVQFAARLGEPIQTVLPPADAEALVRRCGLTPVEDVGASDLHKRYWSNRPDDLTICGFERYLVAAT